MIAGLVGLLLALLFLSKLKDLIMRHLCLAAAAAAVLVSGCAGNAFIRPDPKLDISIQQKQADTAQAFYKALGDRLQYCTILGNLELIAKASTEAGLDTGAGLNCPARPWDQAPTAIPLSDKAAFEKFVRDVATDAAKRALDDFTAPPK